MKKILSNSKIIMLYFSAFIISIIIASAVSKPAQANNCPSGMSDLEISGLLTVTGAKLKFVNQSHILKVFDDILRNNGRTKSAFVIKLNTTSTYKLNRTSTYIRVFSFDRNSCFINKKNIKYSKLENLYFDEKFK